MRGRQGRRPSAGGSRGRRGRRRARGRGRCRRRCRGGAGVRMRRWAPWRRGDAGVQTGTKQSPLITLLPFRADPPSTFLDDAHALQERETGPRTDVAQGGAFTFAVVLATVASRGPYPTTRASEPDGRANLCLSVRVEEPQRPGNGARASPVSPGKAPGILSGPRVRCLDSQS